MYFAGASRPYSLPRLPMPRLAPAVEAGDDHDSMLLNLEEYSLREAPHARTATASIHNRKLQWMFRDRPNRVLDRQCETFSQLRADVVIPCPRFQQILVCFRGPYDRQCHGFLNRPSLTCSHGMTSEGFCSCRAIR